MNDKKCVLAYSGGLDTSAIVVWLVQRGYEVHCVLVDVGQREDMAASCEKALRMGAATAIIRDARPAMFERVIPITIGLGATYEGNYRLGTSLARPFIAMEQVKLAKALGGATLVHGATGKGNDQIRFEFAYRSLAPDCPVLAPWKCWDLSGRVDLIQLLRENGIEEDFAVTKDFSMDENLWHLSVEGGPLEDPSADLDVQRVLDAVKDRFGGGAKKPAPNRPVRIEFVNGVPVSIDGQAQSLMGLIAGLNERYRAAAWAWDLVIENRFTGIKSRGLYINPAAKLLNTAVDALARCCLNKPTYDAYVELGRQYGQLLYRGEYFSTQTQLIESAALAVMKELSGAVEVSFVPAPYVSKIDAPEAIFRKQLATFEKSDYSHADAAGFIKLNWLSHIGKSDEEAVHADVMETGEGRAPDVRADQRKPARRLVPAAP
jgi:argininosuccinate synthase